MGRRSLQASAQGIEIFKKAVKRKKGGQTYLAGAVGCSRQTIWSLLQGNPVDCDVFMAVCQELELNWEDIAQPEAPESEAEPTLDALVQEVRQKLHAHIQRRCGTMRVLDMEQPISLDSIYTKVNILEKVSRNQRRTIAELLEGCDLEDFDRFMLGRVWQERVPGLEAVQQHDKLLILGKPGAGKTTFLKWLAIQCNAGQLHPDRVPIFITLKEFAETAEQPSLLSFIRSQFESYRIDAAERITEKLLQEGKTLILLDGLDEVRDVDHDRILKEICDSVNRFDTSQFIITCRIAAREYTFQQFTEVEVADFDDEQIAEFSQKWFHEKDPVKAEQFPDELKTHQPLKELATNPLLLTLLCLVFEEQAGFPASRADLYKEGLDILLKKWDAKRNIKRDEVYKDLSLKRKEDLLSQIGFTTFEHSEYFFKQRAAEQQIEQYIRNLPNAKLNAEALQLDSEAVLKSIEAQHGLLVERARGIYSFSHLTFHEYFTAYRIERRQDLYPVLVSHLTEKRWREVFLLTVGMLEEADSLLLLIKSRIDQLLASDEKLQQFLTWLNQKSRAVNPRYKIAAVRAFYLDLDLDLDLDLNLALNLTRDRALNLALALDLDLARDLDIALALNLALDLDLDRALNLALALNLDLDLDLDLDIALDIARNRALNLDRNLDRNRNLDLDLDLDSVLKQSLQSLKEQYPNPRADWSQFKHWWQTNGLVWTNHLRTVMIEHRNIGHDWQFSDTQKQLLQQYYKANKLLVDCLKSECYVSREVRQEIEESLLLPMAEIEQQFPNQYYRKSC